jgi:signal transduction histidine kinase
VSDLLTFKNKKQIQGQQRTLLLSLVLITLVESVFFWHMLSKLYFAYHEVGQTQKVVALAGELSRNFLEESKLRDSLSNSSPGKRQQIELRSKIRQNLKDTREIVADKESNKLLKEIQTEWQHNHNDTSTLQLMILIRSFVNRQQASLGTLQSAQIDSFKATKVFVIIYMFIFVSGIFILGQYSKRKIFIPLDRLFEKIKNFEAGHHELPPPHGSTDEIGALEGQFYNMANRVGSTVAQLKELDRVKTDFISIASHELRTPMTSVKGSLSLILSGNLSEIDPDVKEILTIAEKETDRLIRLINDILDLTKMEANKLSLDLQWNQISEVVDSAVQGLAGLYEVSKVSIAVSPYIHPIQVKMDKDRIQQVITNLLSNAVKFSPAGSVITVKSEPYEKGIVVSINDRGQGITVESQAHMFEKFASYDSGKSKIIKGTGLGLPICKAIVEQHGGQIGVKSELNQGSTFFFFLPEARILSQSIEQAA